MPPTATMAQVSTKILNSPLNNNSIPKVGYQLGRDNVGLRLTQQNKTTINMVRRQPLPWYYQLPLEQTTDSDSNWVSFSLEKSRTLKTITLHQIALNSLQRKLLLIMSHDLFIILYY